MDVLVSCVCVQITRHVIKVCYAFPNPSIAQAFDVHASVSRCISDEGSERDSGARDEGSEGNTGVGVLAQQKCLEEYEV